MTNVQNFVLWFLDNLPDFLMSEPIKYFVGIAIFALIIQCVLVLIGRKGGKYNG